MPTLSARDAMNVGPTINAAAEMAAPRWRQEDHEIPLLRSAVAMKSSTPRPMTKRMDHSMGGPAINSIAVRQGNHNPDAAGEGGETSTWALSHQMMPGMGEEPVASPMASTVKILAVGLGVGYLLWSLGKRRQVRI